MLARDFPWFPKTAITMRKNETLVPFLELKYCGTHVKLSQHLYVYFFKKIEYWLYSTNNRPTWLSNVLSIETFKTQE